MSLAAKLQLRQSQSLVMTPQLMQSIRLLQLTHLELDRFVDEEIERNPLLERVETGDESTAEPQAEAPETAAEDPDWFSEDNGGLDARAIAGEFDASLENIYPDEPGTIQAIGPDSPRSGSRRWARHRSPLVPTASISRISRSLRARCATMPASRSASPSPTRWPG